MLPILRDQVATPGVRVFTRLGVVGVSVGADHDSGAAHSEHHGDLESS